MIFVSQMAYEIHISGFIGDPGFFGGDYYNLAKLEADLAGISDKTETEIDVIINSGGGWVTEGFGIHDRLAELPQKVNTKIIGTGGSIATVIALAPKSQNKGGITKMSPNAEYFIHNPTWSPQSGDPIEADELLRLAEDLKANEEKLISFYSNVTGTDSEVIREKMKAATTLSASQAKELGFIDEITSTQIKAATIYRFAAHVTKTNQPMEDIKKMFADFKKSFTNEIKTVVTDLVKPVIQNASATDADGKVIYYEGALEVGTKCYSDETMDTPSLDGSHVIDGATYTVAGGEITEVVVEEDEMEAVKKDLETEKANALKLTEDLKVANEKIVEIENNSKEKLAALETKLTSQFENFKSNFFTGENLKPEFTQGFRDDNHAPATPSTETTMQIAARIKREKTLQK